MSEPHLDEIFDDIDAIEFGGTKDKIEVFWGRARSHPAGSEARSCYLTVLGDHLQMTGRYDEARSVFEEVLASGHRSYQHPLVALLDLDLDGLHIGCLHGRFRVRRELGLPLDSYDRASVEVKEMYAERPD